MSIAGPHAVHLIDASFFVFRAWYSVGLEMTDGEGQPVNVRYSGPPEYLRHTTRQKLIRAASDYVQETRYAPTEVYTTGCEFELNYVVRWQRNTREGEPPPNI